MPLFLLGLWRYAKPLLPYILSAIAAVALLLLLWRAPWATSRQKAKDATALAAQTARADGFRANQDTLTAALTRQNAAVAALKADGDKRVQEGKTALKAAQKANQGLLDTATALRRNAALKPAVGDPCVVSETLIKAGEI